MTVPNFIKQVYIKEIGEIARTHDYLSIMLMMMGIEFLGHCADPSNSFAHYGDGYGEKRFNDAAQRLFPKEHWNPSHRLDFYSRLRNGFAHRMKPSKAAQNPMPELVAGKEKIIYLAGRDCPHLHLFENSEFIVLRSDGLYTHFKTACEKCIALIENSKFTKPDFDLRTDDYLSITPALTILPSCQSGILIPGDVTSPNLSS